MVKTMVRQAVPLQPMEVNGGADIHTAACGGPHAGAVESAKIEVAQVDLDWQHKGEFFIAQWAHDTSGHQGRDATYRWARERGVDLTMDTIAQVIHECETCAAIKQSKRLKPLWYGGRWLKHKYGEAWQIDYITLPQTRQGKRYVLTMVEATTGWLETYPVPHATARNTILGLEKQVLWRHGTPERIESDKGTHFRNNLIDTWAKEHGIEWVYHIPYHAPASGKIERYNGLLKTKLRAMGGGTFKHWDMHLAKATWLVNNRGSVNRPGPAHQNFYALIPLEGDKVPVVHIKNMLGKTVWVTPASGKGKPIRGIAFAQGPGCTWWVLVAGGATGVTSVRRCQKLPPYRIEPVPAGSKTDPPLAKAETISDGGSTSVITYLRRGKKLLCNSSRKRGLRTCERNNSADTKVSEEGRRGGAPGTGAEIPLQSVVKTMVKQVVPLQATKDHGGTDIHPAALGGPHARAGGCALTLWRARAGVGSWQDLWPRRGPMLEQFMKNCSPWEGPMLEKVVKDCLLWVGPHTGAGEECEEEGVAERKHYELTTTLIPCPSAPLWGRR
ncbi:hypothetical protein QYF61_013340 [Mycteria americana]|uniref:Integrase catalytic domain-containing protein n=1 Tax=Mycteria americana TaxID=33587 RepID=A0AAN7RNL0_MYCAM|nr:hypothetical protein QYF61_013340 [Mycteria americana]